MREESNKIRMSMEEEQVNKDKHERRNKKIRMRIRGETRKLGWGWEEKQVNKDNHERSNK